MSGMERIFQIDQILAGRQFVPRKELQEKLGVSWATLKRDLNYLKDRLNAPIVFDRDLGGCPIRRPGRRRCPGLPP
jgi:predicted DNA-binding transcriptional regulator YafY